MTCRSVAYVFLMHVWPILHALLMSGHSSVKRRCKPALGSLRVYVRSKIVINSVGWSGMRKLITFIALAGGMHLRGGIVV